MLTASDSLANVSSRLTHSFCMPSSISASGSGGKLGAVGLGFPDNGGVDACPPTAKVGVVAGPGLFVENSPPARFVGLVEGGAAGGVVCRPKRGPVGGVAGKPKERPCCFSPGPAAGGGVVF